MAIFFAIRTQYSYAYISFITEINHYPNSSISSCSSKSDQCQTIQVQEEFVGHPEGLTTFWAQEYVGSDLLKDEIRNLHNPTQVYVVDQFGGLTQNSSGSRHGDFCQRLINNQNEELNDHVTSSFAQVSRFNCEALSFINDPAVGGCTNLDEASQSFAPNSIISLSQPLYKKNSQYSDELFNKVMNQINGYNNENIAIVTSTGNKYNTQNCNEYSYTESQNEMTINVGNIGSTGFVFEDSCPLANVTIAAPAGSNIMTRDNNDNLYNFAGTSASTPTVAGALSNIKLLLPNITPSQMKKLLVNTALPTPNILEEPNLNGHGSLNSYKLYHVAKRIKESCNHLENLQECINRKIEDDSIYQFNDETNLLAQIDSYFPECRINGESSNLRSRHEESRIPFCQKRRELLTQLRKLSFLQNNNENLFNKISCIYYEEGYEENSTFYRSVANTINIKNGGTKEQLLNVAKENILSVRNHWASADAIRFISDNYPDELEGILSEAIRNENSYAILGFEKYFANFNYSSVPPIASIPDVVVETVYTNLNILFNFSKQRSNSDSLPLTMKFIAHVIKSQDLTSPDDAEKLFNFINSKSSYLNDSSIGEYLKSLSRFLLRFSRGNPENQISSQIIMFCENNSIKESSLKNN